MILHLYYSKCLQSTDCYHFKAINEALVDGCKPLPPLTHDNKAKFLAEYNKVVDQCSQLNANNSVYWYSSFALQNIWHSSFYIGLESYFRLQQLLQDNHTESLSLYCDSSIWSSNIKELVKQFDDCRLKLPLSERVYQLRQKLFSPIQYLRSLYNTFKFMRSHITGKDEAYKPYSNRDLIFVSVWFKKTFNAKPVVDPFFSDLPHACQQAGLKVGVFSHIQDYQPSVQEKLSSVSPIPVESYVNHISNLDLIRIVAKALLARIKLPKIKLLKPIRADIQSSRSQHICYALLMQYALQKVLKNNLNANIIHMYEGHSWEYGCQYAARQAGRPCFGYQHSAILPSHIKMRIPGSKLKPVPDIIFTTGKVAKKILVDHWGHDANKVVSACAFRRAAIYQYTPALICTDYADTILILLQGLSSDLHWVHHICSNLHSTRPRQVIVRQHPLAPLRLDYSKLCHDDLTKMADSEVDDLYTDILRSNVVIYHGTTAALEAIALGVPALYVDLGKALPVDPVFEKPGLCADFKLGDDLFGCCDALLRVPAEVMKQQQLSARRYYEDYFTCPNEEITNKILNTVLR